MTTSAQHAWLERSTCAERRLPAVNTTPPLASHMLASTAENLMQGLRQSASHTAQAAAGPGLLACPENSPR